MGPLCFGFAGLPVVDGETILIIGYLCHLHSSLHNQPIKFIHFVK
jgi:hypothetical protein